MHSNARTAMPIYTARSLGSFSMWKASTMHS
jgi:hypothetical protein